MQKITPCLWFDTEGEEAAEFYTSIFPNSRIVEVTRYGSAGPCRGIGDDRRLRARRAEVHGPNGGPDFKFNEAISLEVHCETQEEVDRYWSALTADGARKAVRLAEGQVRRVLADRPQHPPPS